MLEEIKDWMVSHWEVDRQGCERSVEAFKVRVKLLAGMELKAEESAPDEESSTEVASPDEESEKVPVEPEKKPAKKRVFKDGKDLELKETRKEKKFQNLAEERDGGFVVVYQRAGRGTLHQLGPGACWMARKRSFAKSETFRECPEPEYYSTWCKLCWKEEKGKGQESTSDSADDLDLSDITDGER